MDMEQLKQMLR